MIKKLDDWLNSMTMYRLVLYALGVLAGVTLLFSALGTLNYGFFTLLGSFVLVTGLSFLTNIVLAKMYHLPVNQESSLITGLILFFIVVPPSEQAGWLALVVAAVASIASKYVITWRRASLLNPAAAGALVLSLTKLGSAGWWIASEPMFIFTLAASLLIIRKTRRFTMAFSFMLPALVLTIYWLMHGVGGTAFTEAFKMALMSYPIIFLAGFMLTEPSSMPQTASKRIMFGMVVGLLFGSHIKLGILTMTPHAALVVGNLFAFAISTRATVRLKLLQKREIAPNIYDFIFEPLEKFRFSAGQYMEWTVPGVKIDSRGNRRTFTMASSPREKYVRLGFKTYTPSSNYKAKLLQLEAGDIVIGSHVEGDFVLPHSTRQKLIFIAGGIGVTPFRSHIADMILKKEKRDITLYYQAKNEAEIVYTDIWEAAKKLGVKFVPITDRSQVSESLLKKHSPHLLDSMIYLSGPPGMIHDYKHLLKKAGVKKHRIHTDYFSGY